MIQSADRPSGHDRRGQSGLRDSDCDGAPVQHQPAMVPGVIAQKNLQHHVGDGAMHAAMWRCV